MSDAPERIWVEKAIAEPGTHGSTAWPDEDADCIEYTRADLSDALVAAAYDAAARAAFRAGKSVHSGYRDENERIAQRIENELRLEVQAAIRGAVRAGPRTALDALLKAERERALREAAEVLRTMWASNNVEHEAAILDLIEKDQADG